MTRALLEPKARIEQGVAGHRDDVGDPRDLQQLLLHPTQHVLGSGQGGGVRQLDLHEEVALVLLRQKAAGQVAEHPNRAGDQGAIDDDGHKDTLGDELDPCRVAAR